MPLPKTPAVPLPKTIGIVHPRPPTPRRPPVFPRGPRFLALGTKATQAGVGPGEPPLGFVTAHSSKTEWLVYWGAARVLRDPKNPRQPPFTGGRNWQYQVPFDAVGMSTDQGRISGGNVMDFVFDFNGRIIGVRVQTDRYHLTAGAEQMAKDVFISTHLGSVDEVIDIFDTDFVGDETGEAVCKVVADALRGVQRPDPLRSGTFNRVRA